MRITGKTIGIIFYVGMVVLLVFPITSQQKHKQNTTTRIQRESDRFALEASRLLAKKLTLTNPTDGVATFFAFRANRVLESDCDGPESFVLSCMEYVSNLYQIPFNVAIQKPFSLRFSQDPIYIAGEKILATLSQFETLKKHRIGYTVEEVVLVEKELTSVLQNANQLLDEIRKTIENDETEKEPSVPTELVVIPTISELFAPIAQLLPAQ